jgi:hypothetical protein
MGSKLTKSQVDAICKRVYSRYPELRGTRPKVKPKRAGNQERFLLRFETVVSAADGASLPIIVRATADTNGRILKLSSSR